MKNKTLTLLLALTVAMTSMTGCGNKETEAPAATEAVVEAEPETEAAELAVTTLATDFVFETGRPITVFDLLSDVSSTSEVTVAYSDETALVGAQAEEAQATESVEDTESTESVESTEYIESTENTETAEETLSFDSYGFALTDMPVLCYTEAGEYTNTITVTSAKGEVFTQELHFTIADAPVITAEDGEISTGDEEALAAFTCSASATDAADGDLTASITADASALKLDTEGTYPVTFTVRNSFGIEASKTVEVAVKAAAEKKTEKNTASTGKDSGKKTESGKTAGTAGNSSASNSNTSSNNNASNTSGNSGNSSSNTPSDNGNSGNTSGDSGNSGNSNQASGNSGNAGTPTTPSTDNSASTPSAPVQETPSTPAPDPAPSTPDTGSSGGEMQVPDGENIINGDDIVNPPIDQLGGSGAYWE